MGLGRALGGLALLLRQPRPQRLRGLRRGRRLAAGARARAGRLLRASLELGDFFLQRGARAPLVVALPARVVARRFGGGQGRGVLLGGASGGVELAAFVPGGALGGAQGVLSRWLGW